MGGIKKITSKLASKGLKRTVETIGRGEDAFSKVTISPLKKVAQAPMKALAPEIPEQAAPVQQAPTPAPVSEPVQEAPQAVEEPTQTASLQTASGIESRRRRSGRAQLRRVDLNSSNDLSTRGGISI